MWSIGAISNGLLRALGVDPEQRPDEALGSEELRTIVGESGPMIPPRHKRKHENYGWLVTRAGMLRLLDKHPGDIFELNKLRLFLERQVWKTPRA